MKHKDPLKWYLKFLVILIIIFVLWFGYVYFTNVTVEKRHVLAVKSYTADITLDYTLESPYECNNDIKKDLDKLFKAGGYFYAEKSMRTSIGAITNLTLRKITMNDCFIGNKNLYTFFLAHELTHLKYYTANECFTEYTAIITLYESGNDYFKNVALWRASLIIQSNLQDEYDCGYYLLEYFAKYV